VGLEVLLGGGDELDGGELEAALLEALDDGADQAALGDKRCQDGGRCLLCCGGIGGEGCLPGRRPA